MSRELESVSFRTPHFGLMRFVLPARLWRQDAEAVFA
jgi:hypothetical protein